MTLQGLQVLEKLLLPLFLLSFLHLLHRAWMWGISIPAVLTPCLEKHAGLSVLNQHVATMEEEALRDMRGEGFLLIR